MKLLVFLTVACFAATANAQVRCTNPGSVHIPTSPCCGQVAGQGLAGAVGAFFDFLDLECKFNMFFTAVIEDPEVLEFFNYITGPEFTGLIVSMHSMQEWQDFMQYLCFNLQLDGYLYYNTLLDILGIPRMPHPQGPNCHPDFPVPWRKVELPTSPARPKTTKSSWGGVRGTLDAIKAEIPNDDIYDMWLFKIENDPYLCPGFLKLSSPDFIAVATKVEYHPDFIRLVMKLEDWGVEMFQFMEDLKQFLWFSDYCR